MMLNKLIWRMSEEDEMFQMYLKHASAMFDMARKILRAQKLGFAEHFRYKVKFTVPFGFDGNNVSAIKTCLFYPL